VDHLRKGGVTVLMTSLLRQTDPVATEMQISSIVDTWIVIHDAEVRKDRRRQLYVLKSRGMRHSRRLWELVISDTGISVVDATRRGESSVRTARIRAVASGALK
ncbi:MAG TPA: ATPase domain-containing protein, partial [Casimicrobiaceae bacterium]|nr:ATPase domain-containing protein [Casimicrobiaceae bacterium]